ncbi:serine/threonine-protein kinase GRIK1-like isoform X2 [Glycine soja]|uniref:non-specific serine/threonine protein kinase n=1 Tax=Glycine soja TaxID=3848 RepID=A0A0B2RFJ6_GLYSO|nr:serine/threonine-protein kinase GRIK1-like isoform X2 [Glycine soja]KHN32080.1 Putative serine/threonine-protein kinase [Glycine soja]RZB74668.1 Serine/threonine-protein kinase GRIK2 isoform B [Glycine soja]RZB74669.1 Serine/threonine-protein kinase GRIK2 isoform C [Glycine soja]
MLNKTLSFAMGCCSCFGFIRTPNRQSQRSKPTTNNNLCQEPLLDDDIEDEEGEPLYNDEVTNNSGDEGAEETRPKRSEEILNFRVENGMICRQFPVKETRKLVRSEDENGNKMINEYIREYKIGSGSYGKVALYRSSVDDKHYAIKAFHKSYLLKLRVAPSETAMMDVLREVLIMKMLEHPNIVNLIEVIDDPETDNFYMVLEYVEGKWICEGSGPTCGLGEETARRYLRDIVSGLTYLHAHNIVHLDIKPDNLLITCHGTVKIGDFSVSQAFEDDKDELRRSPGTPVFTAPECILGVKYGGKAADTWAVGVTLYCMILGEYPFLGDTLQDTYDKIVNNPLVLPNDMNPPLKNLIEGLLSKDPSLRMTLGDVAEDSWVIGDDGPIPDYLCWCKRKSLGIEDNDESNTD